MKILFEAIVNACGFALTIGIAMLYLIALWAMLQGISVLGLMTGT